MGATYDSMARMWRLFWPGVAALAALAAGLALRALLLGVLRRWGRTRNGWASFAQAIRLPSVLWLVVLAAWIGIEVASETAHLPRRLSSQLRVVFEALIIASVTLSVAGAVSTLIQHASERRALGGPVTGLGQAVARGVGYASDPDHVERVLLEETRAAVAQVPGLLGDPPPFVRFIPGFGESSLDFTLICQVATFVDQYVVQHELRKRILRRFRAEGIEIPFPIRTVELRPPGGERPAGDT